MGEMFAGVGLLGLLAGALWGVGDFSGGMAVKVAGGSTRSALKVVLLSHASSLVLLAGFAWWHGQQFPHGAGLLWGLAAGVLAGLSISAFYVALATGEMGSAAALSGLLAAAVPALVSGFTDGLPGWQRFTGFLVAGAAIWLIAAAGPPAGKTSATALAVVAGTGFGLYFVAVKFAVGGGVAWTLAAVRVGSILTCAVVLLALILTGSGSASRGGTTTLMCKRVLLWVLATATFDTAGNLFFVAATRAGRLDIAGVLASLYPASTILLAGVILKERLTRRQWLGMALAVAAVVLITL